MKLKAPADCRSISIGGCMTAVDDDGYIDVDQPGAEILIAHGFILSGKEESGNAPSVVDVSGLSRRELFHMLKEHNVSVSLPITNEALKVLARQALNQTSDERRHF